MIRIDPKLTETAGKLDAYFGVRLLALDGLAEFLLHRRDTVPAEAELAVIGEEGAVRAALKHMVERNPHAKLVPVDLKLVSKGETTHFAKDFEHLRVKLGVDVLTGLVYSEPPREPIALIATLGTKHVRFLHQWIGADPESVKRHAEGEHGGLPGTYTIRDKEGGPVRLTWTKEGSPEPQVEEYAVTLPGVLGSTRRVTIAANLTREQIQTQVAQKVGARVGDTVSYQRVNPAAASASSFTYHGLPRFFVRWVDTRAGEYVYAYPGVDEKTFYDAAVEALKAAGHKPYMAPWVVVSEPDGDTARRIIKGE